ncbi:MAG: NADH-quinone oxidoreductase subunit N [Anaerolineales bacterium]|jgi:NADH-quinone oxidoreductase subunit N|nr:NADH-quinone oxidoreductase subunit N [Anaerolineales bacterium]HUV25800.1 NADH-quinone oxidoreductase subunit N [Anaerolineales bacterium]
MTLGDLTANLIKILPLSIVILWACVLLLVDLFIPKDRKPWTAALAALGMLVAMGLSIAQTGIDSEAFGGMLVVDGFSQFLTILVLGSGLVAVMLSYDYLTRLGIQRGEYYVLLMFSISGIMLMSMAADLIVIFLALELLSIPLYILAGFAIPRTDSEEAAIKYFLLGAFASGFLVYGVALVFGATGYTGLTEVLQAIESGAVDLTLLSVGAALILVGLSFKVAAVPFHMWTPDVYQGAPSSVTAFMAVGAKVGGFAALMRIFVTSLGVLAVDFTAVLWGLAALTMILGNIVAIAQKNIKRMLAYSSIAQAGYILMALVPYGQKEIMGDVIAAALLYLVAYAMMNFAAWAVVITLEKAEGKGLELSDYAGLGRKYPVLAAIMTVAMLSFTGIPPTLGFIGKFYLFRSVIDGGFIWLAIIGGLTSLVSAYYYLRVVIYMYMQEGEPVAHRDNWVYLTAAVTGIGMIVLGIFSLPLLNWAYQAAISAF